MQKTPWRYAEQSSLLISQPSLIPFVAPNHDSVHVPQNEAFLSAVRNAKESIFIQTPNLNAEPLLPALLEAVRRGVNVTYYVCLGYNDAVCLVSYSDLLIREGTKVD